MKKNILLILLIIIISLVLLNYPYEFTTKHNISKTETYIKNLQPFSWIKENSGNYWKYYNGFIMFALINIDKPFVENFYNENINIDGTINSKLNPANRYQEGELDSVLPVRTLLYLENKPKYDKMKNYVYRQIELQPSLQKCGGNFRHKINNENWKTYPFALDGLYMALPFLVEYKNFDVSNRLNWVSKNMKAQNGLYYHGAQEDGTPNGVVWLRGIGWYAMAQVDILDHLPEGAQKEKMKSDLILFFDSMLKYQNKYNGMWKNIVYPQKIICNKYETSGTLMMAYALLKTYNEGYVNDQKYKKAGLKAFNGVVQNNLGKNLKNIYLSASVSDDANYYCNCKKYVSDDAKGIAPLILTYQEILKIK